MKKKKEEKKTQNTKKDHKLHIVWCIISFEFESQSIALKRPYTQMYPLVDHCFFLCVHRIFGNMLVRVVYIYGSISKVKIYERHEKLNKFEQI